MRWDEKNKLGDACDFKVMQEVKAEVTHTHRERERESEKIN